MNSNDFFLVDNEEELYHTIECCGDFSNEFDDDDDKDNEYYDASPASWSLNNGY